MNNYANELRLGIWDQAKTELWESNVYLVQIVCSLQSVTLLALITRLTYDNTLYDSVDPSASYVVLFSYLVTFIQAFVP